MCRIGQRSDDDEIVVHHVEAPHPEALSHEFVFRRPVVHEHHVGVAPPSDVECLSGADGYYFHLNAGLRGKARQQETEQA